MTWHWLELSVVLALHDAQIAEHGGLAGIRDLGLVESALLRPQNLAAYQAMDAPDLAAAYAFGFARNHGFVDGNKRVAWISGRLFLRRNGWVLNYQPAEAVRLMEDLAGGRITEEDLMAWYRACAHRLNAGGGE